MNPRVFATPVTGSSTRKREHVALGIEAVEVEEPLADAQETTLAVFPEVLHARALDQAPPKCVIGDRGHNAGIVRTRIFARTSQLVCQDAPEGVEVRARLRKNVEARPVLRIHELGLPRVEDQLDPFDACDFADGLVG